MKRFKLSPHRGDYLLKIKWDFNRLIPGDLLCRFEEPYRWWKMWGTLKILPEGFFYVELPFRLAWLRWLKGSGCAGGFLPRLRRAE